MPGHLLLLLLVLLYIMVTSPVVDHDHPAAVRRNLERNSIPSAEELSARDAVGLHQLPRHWGGARSVNACGRFAAKMKMNDIPVGYREKERIDLDGQRWLRSCRNSILVS